MHYDYRQNVADYYDRFSGPPWDDIGFYRSRLPGPDARVLELGCGTGRVLLPLAEHVALIYGLDISPAMLAICDKKLEASDLPAGRAKTLCADITDFDLTHEEAKFDLITAPFRVMQNLETDAQVDGMMRSIRKHLAPGGEAVLNTFRPRGGYEALKAFWSKRDGTTPCWTRPDGEYTLSMADDCTVFQEDPVAVFPRLIYRRHDKAGDLIDEQVLEIVMRVWQPDELVALVERHGFTLKHRFGGYEGEAWADGPELVVSFTH
ncbi:MAG: class I SAM-dependent methyltransferase [Planctomycetota bacterium]